MAKTFSQSAISYQGGKTTGKKLSKPTLKRKIAKYHMGRGYEKKLGAILTAEATVEYEALDYLMIQDGSYLIQQDGSRFKLNE